MMGARVRALLSSSAFAERATRVSRSMPAVIQIVVAAVISYGIAHWLVGHSAPVLSLTVTVTSLSFARDARPIRVLETAVGMTCGIVLSSVLLALFGYGLWQTGLILFGTLVLARFLSPSSAFALAAAVQSLLVAVLPMPEAGVFSRLVDALIGGGVALLCTALVPRDPRRAALRDARALFTEIDSELELLITSLNRPDAGAAEDALGRARSRTGRLLESWQASQDSAVAIARISPFLRSRRAELARMDAIRRGMDLATRSIRVTARRVIYLVRDGRPQPELAEVFTDLRAAVRLLAAGLTRVEDLLLARQALLLVAARLDPFRNGLSENVVAQGAVMTLRPLVVDLLESTGMSADDARRSLPEL